MNLSLDESEEGVISNVPLALLSSYSDRDIIVRGPDPVSLVKAVLETDSDRIKSVQLLSPGRDIAALSALPGSIAIDLCLSDLRQADGISSWNNLLEDRGVRLVVPVIDGFGQVVKEALRANLRIMLQVDQPGNAAVDELEDTFVFFVREPGVKQPVDLFGRLLSSFLTGRVESLWRIQEEHPSSYRYITDTGEITLSSRLAGTVQDPRTSFLADLKLDLFLRKAECCTCRFFPHCEGYFKLPIREYSCSGIKELLGIVRDCAAELRTDLSQVAGSPPADS